MAVVGHWANLEEAQKLTQTVLQRGIVQTIIEQGDLLPMMPVKQLNGKSLTYNREKSWTASQGANFYDIHEIIPWTADQEYSAQVEVNLKRIARQDAIDKFMQATYTDANDYRAVLIAGVIKRVIRFTEHMIIYGDATNGGAKQFDGLHRLNQATTAVAIASLADGDVNIDGGESALSLSSLRMALDTAKVDQIGKNNVAILMPRVLARRMDAAYQEAGFVRGSVTVSLGSLTIGAKEVGGRIMTFDGIPIIRSDHLVAEQANTGVSGANSRDLYTSGTKRYSIFVVRFEHTEDTGLEMLFGDVGATEGQFSPFRHETFDKLENYDAGGERLVGYMAPALGAVHSLVRIFDLADSAIVP
jgi:hypothetical protein